MTGEIRKYIVPGLVFQSVVIGGGYGTGREIAEFFLVHGALGAVLGMLVAAAGWSLVLAVAFEFARLTGSYNYKAFFKALLGPFWWVFEINYLLIAVLVLAVLGSGAGEMVADLTGAPSFVGAALLLVAISALAYFGSNAIERTMTVWSVLLYLAYGILILWIGTSFGGDIVAALGEAEVTGGWAVDGLRYAAYNLIALAAVLFILPRLETRREALGAGALAGVIAILPGLFVLFAMLSQYPQIQDAPVPVTELLASLNAAWFGVIFQLILFGTFVETGAGIVHSINERVGASLRARGNAFTHRMRLVISVASLATAMFLATTFGIIALIAQGYGLLSYAFIAVVILPLLTLGVVRIMRGPASQTTQFQEE